MVWDRRKKKYVGFNEASEKHSAVDKRSGTKQLVNEAGKKITKKEMEQKRGKVYEEWSKKNKMSIPVSGEQEAPETARKYEESKKAGRGRWAWKNKVDAPSEATGVVDSQTRNPEQLKKYLKKKQQEKWKNMPKAERLKKQARKNQPNNVPSSRAKSKPGKGKPGKGKQTKGKRRK